MLFIDSVAVISILLVSLSLSMGIGIGQKVIRLSGLEVKDKTNPNGDIEIKYTCLRPGEKLYDELLVGNNVSETNNALIMRAEEDMLLWNTIKTILSELEMTIMDDDQIKLRELLVQAVPDFKPQCKITDLLHKE